MSVTPGFCFLYGLWWLWGSLLVVLMWRDDTCGSWIESHKGFQIENTEWWWWKLYFYSTLCQDISFAHISVTWEQSSNADVVLKTRSKHGPYLKCLKTFSLKPWLLTWRWKWWHSADCRLSSNVRHLHFFSFFMRLQSPGKTFIAEKNVLVFFHFLKLDYIFYFIFFIFMYYNPNIFKVNIAPS